MTRTFNIPEMEEIKDVLWESITSALGIDFVFEDQAAARDPATGFPEGKNYGTLKIITGPVQEGRDDQRFTEPTPGNFLMETVGQRELTLSVNIYREGSGTLMSRLQILFNSRIFKQEMAFFAKSKYSKELIVIEALSSQDLSSLVQSEYEERFQMDVRLRTISSVIESIDPIEEVTFAGEVENQAGEKVDDCTIKTTIIIP